MDQPFDEQALDRLAAEVEQRLTELHATSSEAAAFRGIPGEPEALTAPEPERETLEKAAGEPFETFWNKYKRHLRRDLCHPDGHLHDLWDKWRQIDYKSMVKLSAGWLVALGVATSGPLWPATAAVSVIVLRILANVGIEAFCEGFDEDQGDC